MNKTLDFVTFFKWKNLVLKVSIYNRKENQTQKNSHLRELIYALMYIAFLISSFTFSSFGNHSANNADE